MEWSSEDEELKTDINISKPIIQLENASTSSMLLNNEDSQLSCKDNGSFNSQFGHSLGSDTSALPDDLRIEISRFSIDGFAQKYFADHKKGAFIRQRIPTKELIRWTKDKLERPLMTLNESHHKDALLCFKKIQRIMGDRLYNFRKFALFKEKGNYDLETKEMNDILDMMLEHGELRDEVYVQICKQLSFNPSISSVRKGWEIMSVICQVYPPSKNFEQYLKSFIMQHHNNEDDSVRKIARFCSRKVNRIIEHGTTGKSLTFQEVELARLASFQIMKFGDSLVSIMNSELEQSPNAIVPRVLRFLTQAIIDLDGFRCEGIFRLCTNMDKVFELRCRIEKGKYELKDIKDPTIPAALLKLWFRELEEPVILPSYYHACIDVVNQHRESDTSNITLSQKALEIIKQLPAVHYHVLGYLVCFLQKFLDPKIVSMTKMDVTNFALVFTPNLLKCPYKDHVDILKYTILEQRFVGALLAIPFGTLSEQMNKE